jgi:putative N6-adenine-specific DNA methylase
MEPLLAQEMATAAFQNSTPTPGGVVFDGALTELYRAHLRLRLASHVLLRLGQFGAVGFPELIRKAARLPWENYLKPGQPIGIRVTCHKSKLYHSSAVAERVAEAISTRLGQPAPVVKSGQEATEASPQIILVRLFANDCTISLDSTGEPLDRRGYRQATGKAPLRENLAAGLLLASGWDGRSPLIDPFCGAGTIAIEAALFARQILPGGRREFPFMKWPRFVRRAWNLLLEENQPKNLSEPPLILAADRDAGVIASAQENATRAGVAELIQFSRLTISDFTAPSGTGWVVTNPPYGVRTKTARDLRNLYARFGDVLRAHGPDWHVGVVSNDAQLIRQTGLPLKSILTTENGGLKVQFFTGVVPKN